MSTVMWGIHAGRTGDADALFKKGYIGIGWEKIQSLNRISPNREEFKREVSEAYPHFKPGAIPVAAGQLFRFCYEANVGDYVVYRSKTDHLIHVGQITGPYEYRPDIEPGYPHTRRAKWIKSINPVQVTQGARYEIGSAMSFFQVRNFIDEWLSILNDQDIQKPKPEDTGGEVDPTVGLVAGEIEELTKDFVLKNLAQELKGHPFAEFVAHLLETMGYRTRLSAPGTDGGVDIIAHRDELGFEPPLIRVQVKSGAGKVGQPEVSALLGTLSPGEFGLVVALSQFTPQAIAFAKNKANLRPLDSDDILSFILERYEELDSRYKAIIPLKRVFVPQPVTG